MSEMDGGSVFIARFCPLRRCGNPMRNVRMESGVEGDDGGNGLAKGLRGSVESRSVEVGVGSKERAKAVRKAKKERRHKEQRT